MKAVARPNRGTAAMLTAALCTLCVVAAIGPAVAAPPEVPLKTAFSTDLSDTWWTPTEPGWGLQLTQTGNFIFVTVYAYGTDGKPTWFGGGVTSTGSATFTGKLYVTSGPFYGGTFNPNATTVREAGAMTFEATTINTANFTYTLDGVTVTKAVERQPLTFDDFSGVYVTALTRTLANCTDPASNGAGSGLLIFQITQDGSTMTFTTSSSTSEACNGSGTYTQLGRNGRFDGAYSCSTGDAGNVVMAEMNNHVRQFSARIFFQSTSNGCLSIGRITGVIPDQ